MHRCITVFIFSFLVSGVYAQQSLYLEPWKDSSRALLIDLYHGNTVNWELLATDPRVAGMIHKATDGLKTDTAYHNRRREAERRGYCFGSFHLGRPGDPIAQAETYLRTIQPWEHELMALDLEDDDSTRFMSLHNALRFIEYIHEKTGRYPLVYANHNMTRRINTVYPNHAVWRQCGLWYARFRKDIPDFPQGNWNGYTLWQFCSEINCKKGGDCLYSVPGTQHDMDINIYPGSCSDLRRQWPLLGPAR